MQHLKEKVMETAIFTRMFPEAKLKIIKALKDKQPNRCHDRRWSK